MGIARSDILPRSHRGRWTKLPTLRVALAGLAVVGPVTASPPPALPDDVAAYLAAVNDDTGLDRSPALDALIHNARSLPDTRIHAPEADCDRITSNLSEARGQMFALTGTLLRCDPNPADMSDSQAWLIQPDPHGSRVVIVIGPAVPESTEWRAGDRFSINARFYKRLVLEGESGPGTYLTFVGACPRIEPQAQTRRRPDLAIGLTACLCLLACGFILIKVMARQRMQSPGCRATAATAVSSPAYDDDNLPPDPVDALAELHARSHSRNDQS